MLKKLLKIPIQNLWNRLSRNLIYDTKQVLLYCGLGIPSQTEKAAVDVDAFIYTVTKGTDYGAIYDPLNKRIHFEPSYIQYIMDLATRFDFPVYDKSFGPGGIAGFIHESKEDNVKLQAPSLNSIVRQAMISKNHEMPFSFVSARQLAQFEIEQFSVMTNIVDVPSVFNVTTQAGVNEAEKNHQDGHYIITNHTIINSPLTLSIKNNLNIFVQCVEKQIPVMLTTQPFSGQNAPMSPYGLALIAFCEFIAGMAIAYTINQETKVINGAFPTMCTPGSRAEFKIGTVTHNFVNYLIACTSRMLDIASMQSGATMGGSIHRRELLDTDYETVRGVILWEDIFQDWHMIRHCYGFLGDLVSFSFEKAEDDINALKHIQSLDENGFTAVLANNVRLNRDIQKADQIHQTPTLLFNREAGRLLEVILETVENFDGDFGRHEHTLKNIPDEWF